MQSAGIYARESGVLGCAVQLGVAGGRVISVSFPETPDADAAADHPLLDRIERYLGGDQADDFEDVTVGLTVPTDHRAVLERLRAVSYGESVTGRQLATMTPGLDPDDEADRRTVESALAGNPVPLVIPDHRVRDGPGAPPRDVVATLRSVEGI